MSGRPTKLMKAIIRKQKNKFRLAILCGGPSLERGISLNSARSAMDHLASEQIEVIPIYFDAKRRPFHISRAQLYSNTPSDFDFKLRQTATILSQVKLIALLKSVDIAFPIMHGSFGEDGTIQRFLEQHHIPFVGSSSAACKKAFDKYSASTFIKKQGFFVLPSIALERGDPRQKAQVEQFFCKYKLKRAIVKPACGGSSIGVVSVASAQEALNEARSLFVNANDRVIIEPLACGSEFTMIVLQNYDSQPVALTPTEIQIHDEDHRIFDFRKKYLPTRQVSWHCPPNFDDQIVERIQKQGEELFTLFGLQDVGRFDGWLLSDGNIWFSDFNLISGMEQNSFLFQQASRTGMTHSHVLNLIVANACRRQGIPFPNRSNHWVKDRKPVHLLFGGTNSERQVSLMSGTNVWLKLRGSKIYRPQPYLLDAKKNIWKLPYPLCLNHTVEEIMEHCENYEKEFSRLAMFKKRAQMRLGHVEKENIEEFFRPERMRLENFAKQAKFTFIALHGGDGENGVLQDFLQKQGVKFNGPRADVSRLCMDKWATSQFITALKMEGVNVIPGKAANVKKLLGLDKKGIQRYWQGLIKKLGDANVIVKPRTDGCSTGIVCLHTADDLWAYLRFLSDGSSRIPKGNLTGQEDIVELPTELPHGLLFEVCIQTDQLSVEEGALRHIRKTGWVEMTVGVIGMRGRLKALSPSITIAERGVLSLEEKFQGGTGINITPPPSSIMTPATLRKVKKRIVQLAQRIGIQGYSRIDIFAHVESGDLMIIEVNTLPGLTPSTVLYHQGLAEKPPLFPRELLETLISNKGY